jgi:NitT/TauT family transport system ATP-binding protein
VTSPASPAAKKPNLPRIALEDIAFAYDDKAPVIDGLSLDIGAGETIGIVGPSGCGKSTLLALIAGLQKPSGGQLSTRLEGNQRHPLSMVFQKDTLLPWLTVASNVLFFSRLGKGRRSAAHRTRASTSGLDERVQELLAVGGLSDCADAYPYQLSGGMRRRVAFLAAVAPDPQILLLDEPFSSVDEPTRIGIHQDAYRITRMMEMTTVLVTHDLAEAITLCDRVVILSRRPSAVAKEYVIPFGESRQMLKIRETDEYLALYKSLWHDLGAQIATPPRTAGEATGPSQVSAPLAPGERSV